MMHKKLEIEDLIYLTDRQILYNYIAYRKKRKVYILEDMNNISYYKEFPKDYVEKYGIIDKDKIKESIDDSIKVYTLKIDNLENTVVDMEDLYDKLELLKYEYDNLNKIKLPTENQIMAINHLNKAIRKQKKKIENYKIKTEYQIKADIYKYEAKIESLKRYKKHLK